MFKMLKEKSKINLGILKQIICASSRDQDRKHLKKFSAEMVVTCTQPNLLTCRPFSEKGKKHLLMSGSYEHPKHMLKLMGKKIFTILGL